MALGYLLSKVLRYPRKRVNSKTWAEWYKDEGFVALALNSFGPRSVSHVCTPRAHGDGDPNTWRILDAYGGLKYLAKLQYVDIHRVVLMGFSHGGTATLRATKRSVRKHMLPEGTPKFWAGVAMYPWCSDNVGAFDRKQGHETPLLIIIGELDDWTPADLCVGGASGVEAGGRAIQVHVVRGAVHSFDQFFWKGQRLRRGTNRFGFARRPDRAATAEARSKVESFLEEID